MMRDENEVQRTHDILVAVLTGESPSIPASDDTIEAMRIAADILCWVLKHDHNSKFEENMAELETALQRAGGRLRYRSPN